MKCFAAQYVYCNPSRIIEKGVIQIDDSGIITAIFSLQDLQQESPNTQFYNGIILPALLENDCLSALDKTDIFRKLDEMFVVQNVEFQVGEKAEIFVLEKIDLIGKQFLNDTTLTRLS